MTCDFTSFFYSQIREMGVGRLDKALRKATPFMTEKTPASSGARIRNCLMNRTELSGSPKESWK